MTGYHENRKTSPETIPRFPEGSFRCFPNAAATQAPPCFPLIKYSDAPYPYDTILTIFYQTSPALSSLFLNFLGGRCGISCLERLFLHFLPVFAVELWITFPLLWIIRCDLLKPPPQTSPPRRKSRPNRKPPEQEAARTGSRPPRRAAPSLTQGGQNAKKCAAPPVPLLPPHIRSAPPSRREARNLLFPLGSLFEGAVCEAD